MVNVFLFVFIISMLILWRESPKGNEMATLEILTALVKGGMSPVGACAMGGNMMAESGMKSNIAQRGMTKLTDEQYTQAADAGTIDFIGDSVGYGLCQWTYNSRKRWLWHYSASAGTSVGNEAMQVQFCLLELKTDYSELWDYLCGTKEQREATSRICKEYERPAVNNVETRFGYAQQMYKDYGAILEKIAEEPLSHFVTAPDLSAAEAAPPLTGEVSGGEGDAEPSAYIMGTVRPGEQTPEACFLMAQLKRLGYDVLWDGLTNCLTDFQQRRGLEVDGICGEKTWREILK